jgi:hypothetical protein
MRPDGLVARDGVMTENGSGEPRLVVCTVGGGVDLTDTSDPDSPVLRFSTEEWQAFVAGVRAGEFDFD